MRSPSPFRPAARLLVALALAGALGTAPGAQTWAPAAESAGWTGSGLEGAPVSLLALERSVPGLMYAGLQVAPDGRAGVRKSVDGGKSWITLERGLPAGLAPTAIAVSPDEGRVVLVAGAGGLFRTTNGGATWSEVRQPLPPVTALLFDRADPRVVLAGTELRGNFRSADAGITWRPASAGLPRDRYGATPGAVHLLQHPANPARLYMGANGFGGVYRSDNGGRSWSRRGGGSAGGDHPGNGPAPHHARRRGGPHGQGPGPLRRPGRLLARSRSDPRPGPRGDSVRAGGAGDALPGQRAGAPLPLHQRGPELDRAARP